MRDPYNLTHNEAEQRSIKFKLKHLAHRLGACFISHDTHYKEYLQSLSSRYDTRSYITIRVVPRLPLLVLHDGLYISCYAFLTHRLFI